MKLIQIKRIGLRRGPRKRFSFYQHEKISTYFRDQNQDISQGHTTVEPFIRHHPKCQRNVAADGRVVAIGVSDSCHITFNKALQS